MQELAKKYEDKPDFLVPENVYFARTPKLENSRVYFEELICSVSEEKQKEWLGRLLDTNHANYRGAWFEMMLFGWLNDLGIVEVEPTVEGNLPDYSVEIEGQKIFIEARAVLETVAERNKKRLEQGIFWSLQQINLPYAVNVLAVRSSQFPDWKNLREKTANWLSTSPLEQYEYNVGKTIIVMKTMDIPDYETSSVKVMGPVGQAKWITSDSLKNPLREKAKQHRSIRKAGLPYAIALFIEPLLLSAEEAVKAWFGEEVWVVDFEKKEVVDSYSDQTGLHYYKSEIRHTTVSGTLSVKSEWHSEKNIPKLETWYIENPFAKVSIDSNAFPAQARFIVTEKSDKGFMMTWQVG